MALAPFVRYYWYFEIDEDELPLAQLSFPYGSFELICYLQNPNLLRWAGTANEFFEPDIFYAGQLTKPFIMTFNKKCRCVGASLQPWAGNQLYGIPSQQFTNELVPLNLLERDDQLYTQLKVCPDKTGLFDCMERYLIGKLLKKHNDPMARHLATHIMDSPSRLTLDTIISAIGLSRRRIEQRFIQSTGLSMGTFIRKIRFQKAVHLLRDKSLNSDLTNIGLQAGYYDQAHFINDFRAFSGLSPGGFSRQTTELKDFFKTIVPVN